MFNFCFVCLIFVHVPKPGPPPPPTPIMFFVKRCGLFKNLRFRNDRYYYYYYYYFNNFILCDIITVLLVVFSGVYVCDICVFTVIPLVKTEKLILAPVTIHRL